MTCETIYLHLYLKRKAADYYGKTVKDDGKDEDAGHDGEADHGKDAAGREDKIDMSSLTAELID